MTLTQILSKLKSLVYSKTETDTLLGNKAASSHTHSDYVPKSGGAVMTGAELGRTVNTSSFSLWGGTDHSDGAKIDLYGKGHSTYSGCAFIRTIDASNNVYQMALKPDGTLTWGTKNLAMQEDVIPRSGGSVITGTNIGRVDNAGNLDICGGITYQKGGFIALRGSNTDITGQEGAVVIGANNDSASSDIIIYPEGYASCRLDLRPSSSGTYNLGDSTHKWKTINGVDPGALSLPDPTAGVNITNLLTAGSDTGVYTWTATADGWVTWKFGAAGNKGEISNTSGGAGSYFAFKINATSGIFSDAVMFLPVKKGATLQFAFNDSGYHYAYFFPCAGNV